MDRSALEHNISVIDQYIKDHGKQYGSVSWQMVDQSFDRICEHIRQLSNEIIELNNIIASRDEQSI